MAYVKSDPVPSWIFDLLGSVAGPEETGAILSDPGHPAWVNVDRVEKDGTVVGELSREAVDRIVGGVEAWEQAVRKFLERAARGVEPGPWVVVRRTLAHEHQRSGSGRESADLAEHLQEMRRHPELAEIPRVAGVKEPPTRHPLMIAGHDGVVVLKSVVEGTREWPACLGGEAEVGEVERWFTAAIRWAPWRDRASRRLACLRVEAVHLLPDPRAVLA